MSRIYKTVKMIVSGTLALSILLIPAGARALEGSDMERVANFAEQSSKNTEIRTKLCERYTSGRFGANFSDKENKVRGELGSRGEDLQTKRTGFDAQREEARAAADQKRQEHYVKLLESAVNEEQKAAVAVFQRSVEAAVSKRRAALDAAREEYRTSVDAAIASQKADYEAAIATLKQETDAAIQKAKTSCEAGASSSDVSATLKIELKAAKDTFRASIRDKESLKVQLESLKETRNAAYETAKQVFEQELSDAKAALKAAFPED